MRNLFTTSLQVWYASLILLLLFVTPVNAQQVMGGAPSNPPSVTNDTVIFLLDRFPPTQVATLIGSTTGTVHFQLDDTSIGLLISHGADDGVLQAMFGAMLKSHGVLTKPVVVQTPPPSKKPLPILVPDAIALIDIVETSLTSTSLGKKQLGGKILLDVETGDVKPPLVTHSDMYDLYFYNVNRILFDYKLVNQLVSTAPAGGDLAELKDALAAVTSAFQASTTTTAVNSSKSPAPSTGRGERGIEGCFDLSPILSEVTRAVQQVQQDLSGPGFSPQDSKGGCHHVPYVLTKRAWEAAKAHYGRQDNCAGPVTVQCAMRKLSEQFNQNKAKLCPGTDLNTAYNAYRELHDRLQGLADRFAVVETVVLPDSQVAVPYMIQHQFINVNSSGALALQEMDCGNSGNNQANPKTKSDSQQSDANVKNLGEFQAGQKTSSENQGDTSTLGQGNAIKPQVSIYGDTAGSATNLDGKITMPVIKPDKSANTSATPVDTDASPQNFTVTSGRDALSASAGLLLTSLQSRSYTFAAAPSGSGQILHVDGIGSFRPALSALLNYDIPYLPNYKDIGLAVSAGLVLDLANGKADTSNFGLFVGPSVHLFHRFFITPGWHFGQFADYPVGFGQNPSQVITNSNLGSPVPVKRYTGRFAISFTFQIPTPSAKPKANNAAAPATPKPDSNKLKNGAPQSSGG